MESIKEHCKDLHNRLKELNKEFSPGTGYDGDMESKNLPSENIREERKKIVKELKEKCINSISLSEEEKFELKKDLGNILGKILTKKEKSEIEKAVKRVVKEYEETLRLLGNV